MKTDSGLPCSGAKGVRGFQLPLRHQLPQVRSLRSPGWLGSLRRGKQNPLTSCCASRNLLPVLVCPSTSPGPSGPRTTAAFTSQGECLGPPETYQILCKLCGNRGSERVAVSNLLPPPQALTCAPSWWGASTSHHPARLQRAFEPHPPFGLGPPHRVQPGGVWEVLGKGWSDAMVLKGSKSGFALPRGASGSGGKRVPPGQQRSMGESRLKVALCQPRDPLNPTALQNHGGLLTWAGATWGQ